jgi:hypothetical protein
MGQQRGWRNELWCFRHDERLHFAEVSVPTLKNVAPSGDSSSGVNSIDWLEICVARDCRRSQRDVFVNLVFLDPRPLKHANRRPVEV